MYKRQGYNFPYSTLHRSINGNGKDAPAASICTSAFGSGSTGDAAKADAGIMRIIISKDVVIAKVFVIIYRN